MQQNSLFRCAVQIRSVSSSFGRRSITSRSMSFKVQSDSQDDGRHLTLSIVLLMFSLLFNRLLWNQSQFLFSWQNSTTFGTFPDGKYSTASSLESYPCLLCAVECQKLLALWITAISYNRIGIRDWVIFKSTNRFAVPDVAGVLPGSVCLILRGSRAAFCSAVFLSRRNMVSHGNVKGDRHYCSTRHCTMSQAWAETTLLVALSLYARLFVGWSYNATFGKLSRQSWGVQDRTVLHSHTLK